MLVSVRRNADGQVRAATSHGSIQVWSIAANWRAGRPCRVYRLRRRERERWEGEEERIFMAKEGRGNDRLYNKRLLTGDDQQREENGTGEKERERGGQKGQREGERERVCVCVRERERERRIAT